MGKFRYQNKGFYEVYVSEEVDSYLRMTEWKIAIPDYFGSDRQYGYEKSFLRDGNLAHVNLNSERIVIYGESFAVTVDKVHNSTLENFMDWMDYVFETNEFD